MVFQRMKGTLNKYGAVAAGTHFVVCSTTYVGLFGASYFTKVGPKLVETLPDWLYTAPAPQDAGARRAIGKWTAALASLALYKALLPVRYATTMALTPAVAKTQTGAWLHSEGARLFPQLARWAKR